MINYAYGYFLLLKTPLRPTEGGGGSNKTRGTPARAGAATTALDFVDSSLPSAKPNTTLQQAD